MKTHFNGVATTSLLVGAMRAMETKRSEAEGRFFSDPYAELLAGEDGMALCQRAIAEVGDQPAIAVRTAFMDEKFNAAINDGVRQIVMLAAGMDSRAYRLNFPKDTTIFELDQPQVLDDKRQKLSKFTPQCKRIEVAVDLREDWPQQLSAAGFKRSQKSLWLVEGLLMYLHEAQVGTLLEKINTLASPGDILLCDILGRSLLDAPHMKKQLDFLAGLGAPWHFGHNEPEQFLKQFGWTASATQPGEYAPKRWPFPVAPRHVPNVPRSFFVVAKKN